MDRRGVVAVMVALAAPAAARAEDELTRHPTFLAGMNLDFEAPTLAPWNASGQGAVDADDPHGGRTSARLEPAPSETATIVARVPAAAAAGRRMRVSGWLRGRDRTEGARLFVAAVTPAGRVARSARAPAGTSAWSRGEITLVVPDDATWVTVGVAAGGGGTAWVDDVDIVFEAAAREPISVRGVVVDEAGRPVAGARVAVATGQDQTTVADARSSADGTFAVSVREGGYVLTATSAGRPSAIAATADYGPASPPVSLRLDRRDATIAGHVAGAPLPDDARVVVTCRMDDEWAIFLVDVDRSGRDGRFEVALPDTFCVARVAAAALSSDQPILRKGASAPSTIHVARYAAPPDDTVAWVKAHAVAVSTDRDEPADDLRPLAPLFAGARVWGLGQSALGAHELVDLKDRVIRSLVSERRCAAVVLDVGWGDALGIDEFVHTGRFEAMAGLVGDRLWNWRTYEGQQLIAWLRRWNLDPRHHKVHVYGVGEGGAARAVAPLRAFLDKMDPAAAAAIAPTLAFLVSPRTGADLDRARAAIGGLVADFDRNRARWTARAGAGAWRLARQHARFFEMRANLAADRRTWEQELYEMMRGIVELAPGPIAVWDDEVDVAFGDASTWGGMLRRSLGDRYRAIGFLFHRGNVLASDPRAYGPAPVGDVGEALARAGIPAFGLSLRGHGGAGAWLDDVRPYRHVQRSRADADFAMSIGLSFDGVFFVDEVSPVERVTVEKP